MLKVSHRIQILAGFLALGTGLPAMATVTPDCDGHQRPGVTADPGISGPWAVGNRTVEISGITTEIWYPAAPGSTDGLQPTRYDLREYLAEDDRDRLENSASAFRDCACFRDVPLADLPGRLPVIIQIHGTASFRTASMSQALHWASRGFIVIAADHPRIRLSDVLRPGGTFGIFFADQERDVTRILKKIRRPTGPLAFLAGRMAGDRVGITGHSAGGRALKDLGKQPGVRVLVPMAAGGVNHGASLESTLVIGAERDSIVEYTEQVSGYNTSPSLKRFVGLANAGHLAFTDICDMAPESGGMLQEAVDAGIEIPEIIVNLSSDGCGESYLAWEESMKILNHVTTLAFEETLYCADNAPDQWVDLSFELDGIRELSTE